MPPSPITVKSSKPRPEQAEPPRFELITDLRRHGYRSIVGVDEVGRGALAGPVVVAAVELTVPIAGVANSKQIPRQNRTALCQAICKAATTIRLGQASNHEIDTLGMSAALSLAYQRALAGVASDLVLTDHYTLPTDHAFIRATKGDSLFFPVAAASIVAKVYRDQLMSVYNRFFPSYGWARNVGYGTKEHTAAIEQNGVCPLHRRTFCVKNR